MNQMRVVNCYFDIIKDIFHMDVDIIKLLKVNNSNSGDAYQRVTNGMLTLWILNVIFTIKNICVAVSSRNKCELTRCQKWHLGFWVIFTFVT